MGGIPYARKRTPTGKPVRYLAYAIRENTMTQRNMKEILGGWGCINPVVGGLGRGQGLYVKFLHFLIQKVTKHLLAIPHEPSYRKHVAVFLHAKAPKRHPHPAPFPVPAQP
jgi:hypothetical protein